MQVYEISILVFLKKSINSDDVLSEICSFIDSGMAKIPELLEFHKKNIFKNYCFNAFYPIEQDRIYKSGKLYTFQLRTIDEKLADFFYSSLVNHYNENIKGLTAKIRVIPKKYIEKIYSLTPVILKTDEGYWKGKLSLNEFENRMKINSIKKYNFFMNTKINEDFQLFTSLEFTNNKPIAIKYKSRKILGDKVTLTISSDKIAQELSYMCLGTGMLEINSRGFGFLNYRWL